MSMMIYPFILVIIIFGVQIFLALWTYTDAKSKNLNAFLWTVIVLFVPNLLGLLLYFLVGRTTPAVICCHCGAKIPATSKFCPNCGAEVSNISFTENKNNKKLIIGFFIAMASIILIIGIIFVVNINGGGSSTSLKGFSNYSIGCIETNIGDTWKVSFKKSNEAFRKTINIDSDGPKTIEVEASYGDGKSYLYLYRDGKSLDCFNLTTEKNKFSIDLTQYGPGKITFELTNDDVSNMKFIGEIN